MSRELIHDRGRGPELIGTRITVYDLLPYFLDPAAGESFIARLYDLTPEQVAAARAYVLNHPDTVLAEHLNIEERISVGNDPQVIEQAAKTKAAFVRFSRWLAERDKDTSTEQAVVSNPEGHATGGRRFPSFREWPAEEEARSGEVS